MFYCGSPTQDELLFSELPEYGDPSADNDRGVYIGADVQSLIKQVDFTFTDGVKGSAFIIFHSNSMVPQLKKILLDTVFVIILILILTALGLCTWTYRGVMTPLTQKISRKAIWTLQLKKQAWMRSEIYVMILRKCANA